MNPHIAAYFQEIETRLIESAVVSSYEVRRQSIAQVDGKLRVRVQLIDAGTAELFEYVREQNEMIVVQKYSFHWQDEEGNLRRRWDSAPHYPNLEHAPHHIHHSDGTVTGTPDVPNFMSVLNEIEQLIL